MTSPAQQLDTSKWRDYVISQYRNPQRSPNLLGMSEALAKLLEEVVQAPLQTLETYMSLDGAAGVWLDLHGRRLGLPRPVGATGDQYKRLLKARKRKLVLVPGADNADAYLEDVFQNTDGIDAAFVDSLTEPAAVRLFVRDSTEGTAQLAIAADLIPKPAGVRLEYGAASPTQYERGFPPGGSNPRRSGHCTAGMVFQPLHWI